MSNWATFEEMDGEVLNAVHIAPLFGPEHICSDTCWCHPDHDEDDPMVVIHNVAH